MRNRRHGENRETEKRQHFFCLLNLYKKNKHCFRKFMLTQNLDNYFPRFSAYPLPARNILTIKNANNKKKFKELENSLN